MTVLKNNPEPTFSKKKKDIASEKYLQETNLEEDKTVGLVVVFFHF